MYKFNDSFKNEYVQRSTMNERFTRRIFVRTEEYEEIFNKDVANFNIFEIKELFTNLNSSSVNYLNVVKSILSNYTDYIIANGLSIDNINHYTVLNSEIIDSCVNKNILNEKYISRKDILYLIDQCDEVIHQYIILAAFEGIYGEDIIFTKYRDVDFDSKKITLYSGRQIEVSNELLSIIEDAWTTSSIQKDSGKTFQYTNDDTIFKVYINKKVQSIYDVNPKEMMRRMYYIFSVAKKNLGANNISLPRIYLSGLAYKIKTDIEKYNLGVDEYLASEYFDKYADMYDLKKYKEKQENLNLISNMVVAVKNMLKGYL